jgi:hypothetical protein
MLSKKKLPLSIGIILLVELCVYLWAIFTTDPEFVFDKCARNSGRTSSSLILIILIGIGQYGLVKVYMDSAKKEIFQALIVLFSINHFIHLFFVFVNFNHHSMDLTISDNLHGFITFSMLLGVPIIVWYQKRLNKIFYLIILLHLLNVTYFIIKTFESKITPERPAYHNLFGIKLLCLAWVYILYRIIIEARQSLTKEAETPE